MKEALRVVMAALCSDIAPLGASNLLRPQDLQTMSAPRLFVFGLGYTALRWAARLRADGWEIAGTVRDAERAAALQAQGIDAHVFDRAAPLADAGGVLAGTTHLLFSIPPDSRGDPALDRHGADIVRLKGIDWAGYLSTTGVYGDTGGEWVSEASWLRPAGDRQKRRAQAEKGWMDLYRQYGLPLHIFRLSGIYGPGRSAIDNLRAGTAKRVDKPGHVFCRIHVDDIGETLLASMARPNPGGIYNVADDEPAPQHEVVSFAAGLLGMEPPPLVPFDPTQMSEMAVSFYADCRRVKNARIKDKLGVKLRHPDYRSGLTAQLAEEAAG
jgi:hypothetical protein